MQEQPCLSDGNAVESNAGGLAEMLNDAGYIFYRTFVAKNSYSLNDDYSTV